MWQRWMREVNSVRNEDSKGTVKVGELQKQIQKSRMRRFDDVERRNYGYKKVDWLNRGGNRKRTKLRWNDRTKDLKLIFSIERMEKKNKSGKADYIETREKDIKKFRDIAFFKK